MKKNKELWQAIKFTLFSLSAGLIQSVSFTLFQEVLGWTDYWTAYLPSLVLSVLWNFTFNRRYTFHSAANVPKAMRLVALFYVGFTPATMWLGSALEAAGWNDYLIQALNMVINLVTEYFYQRFVVFRKTIDTNDIAKKQQEKEANM